MQQQHIHTHARVYSTLRELCRSGKLKFDKAIRNDITRQQAFTDI